jgi:hypothetical protein
VWTATDALDEGRFSHTATLMDDGGLLVAGGSGQGSFPLSSAEIYMP